MKKLFILFAFLICFAVDAQLPNLVTGSENPTQFPIERLSRSTISEWYNYGASIYNLGGNVSYFRNFLFPDSTVQVEFTGGMGKVWKHSMGQTFDPTSTMFTANTVLNDFDSYTVDSLIFWYRYFRFQHGSPDTLIIQIWDDNLMTFQPNPWSDGRSYANVNYNYLSRKGDSPTQEFTILLGDGDTSMTNQNGIALALNHSVAAGKKFTAAITYFPGNAVNYGDTIDTYMTNPPTNPINSFVVYDYCDNDKILDPLKYNNSLIASTQVRYNISTNGWNGKYIAGTSWNAGFYHTDISFKITANNVGLSEAQNEFIYSNAYPNPFNDEYNISFSLTAESFVSISLYDLNGKFVNLLWESAELPAGKNSIVFNREGLTPGMYFYEISTKEGVLRNKVLVGE